MYLFSKSCCCSFTVGFLFAACASELAAQPQNLLPNAIQASSKTVRLQVVADGLVAPNLLLGPDDGTGRRFIVEQTGQVLVLDPFGNLLAQPFIDVSSDIGTLRHAFSGENPGTGLNPGFDERGLLGLAFHPGFNDSMSPGFGKVYTYHSEDDGGVEPDFSTLDPGATPNHHSVITEWTVDGTNPDSVDPASRRELLRVAEPQFNHNAGMLALDPGGNLLVAFGDGGSANDVADGHTPDLGNGQDRTNILGSIIRIDPLGSNGANGQYGVPADNPFVGNMEGHQEEIFSYGLRNPFRFSLDTDPGSGQTQLVIADVGQNQVEEVNAETLADASGANFGWNVKEGSFYFDPNNPNAVSTTPIAGVTPMGFSAVDPKLEYDHNDGVSVIGGFVYRGSAIPELAGLYIFAEFNGRLFAGDLDSGAIEELNIMSESLLGGTGIYSDLGLNIKGFGQDAAGELYVLSGTNNGPMGTSAVAIKLVAVPEPAAVLLLCSGGLFLLPIQRRKRSGAGTL